MKKFIVTLVLLLGITSVCFAGRRDSGTLYINGNSYRFTGFEKEGESMFYDRIVFYLVDGRQLHIPYKEHWGNINYYYILDMNYRN